MSKKIPLLLIASLVSIILCSHFIPLILQSFLYSLSITIKSGIIFLLPFIIFCLLTKSIVQLTHQATTIIPAIIAGMIISNFISTWISGSIGYFIYHQSISLPMPISHEELQPLFIFEFPRYISNDKAMILGFLFGLLLTYSNPKIRDTMLTYCSKVVTLLLQLISYIVPLFIIGFAIKLHHDGNIVTICKQYAFIFSIIALALIGYIFLVYFVANRGNFRKTVSCIQAMLPAAFTGLSSMSSAAALPLTMIGTAKNSHNSPITQSIIPITVNFHLIGDCFAIPIFAFAILKSYGYIEPSLATYFLFSIYFVLAKFSVAAIPGGGILVMLPILEKYLNFDAPMLSFITGLYILFDPIITCANILGNGGFALFFNNIFFTSMHNRNSER